MQVVVCLCAQITSGTPQFWHFIHNKGKTYPARIKKLKLNSVGTRICILLVFLEVKSPQPHLPLVSHFDVFFFSFISPFRFAILSCLNSAFRSMFVYIQVPPNNPINARAPSLGPRLSLFSEVSYRCSHCTKV